MTTYQPGAVKFDHVSQSVAIKTIYPDVEGFTDRQWGVMTTDRGGCFLSNEQVASWIDLDVPPSGGG